MLKKILSLCLAAFLFLNINSETASVSLFSKNPIIKIDAGAEDNYYKYQWGLKNTGLVKEITYITDRFGNKGERIISFLEDNINSSKDIEIKKSNIGADINIAPAWDEYMKSSSRREVIVAIIDTGVDINHRELKDAIWRNTEEIPNDNIDNDSNGYIDDIYGWNFVANNNSVYTGAAEDEHGTHHAGTIAALWDGKGIAGIADSKYVKLMVLKVLGSADGKGNYSNIKRAIKYAYNKGAAICNISMGSFDYDKDLEILMRNTPMLFVVASGNGDENNTPIDLDKTPIYPAAFNADNIISVANIKFDGDIHEVSNYGINAVDIAAPGYQILSTIPNSSYGFMTGTSMSAPMLSGGLALVYSMRSDMDIYMLKRAAVNTVRKNGKLTGRIKSGGIFDVYAAMLYKE